MIGQENDVKFDEKAKHGSARSHYQAVATFERQRPIFPVAMVLLTDFPCSFGLTD